MNMERDHKLSDHNLDIKNIVPCDEKLNKLIDEIFENQNENETDTDKRNVEETANTFKYQKYVENSKEVFRLSDPAMWLMYAILVSQKMSPEEIVEAKKTKLYNSFEQVKLDANENRTNHETEVDFRDNKMSWAAIAIMSNFWNEVSQKGGNSDTTNNQKTTNPEYKTLLEISLKNYIYGMELRMHHYVSYFAGDNTYRVAKEILKHLITESNQLAKENKPEENSRGGKTSSGSILDVYSSIEPYLQLKEHDGGEAWSRLRAYFYKEGPPFVQNPSRLYVFGAAYVHNHHLQKNQRSPSSSFASSK